MAWISKQPLPIHAPHPSVWMGWLYVCVCVIRCLVLFVLHAGCDHVVFVLCMFVYLRGICVMVHKELHAQRVFVVYSTWG